mgnify:CR=1 FL=1
MIVAIIGATGLVGQEIIKVIEEEKIKFTEILLVATKKNVGKTIKTKTIKTKTKTITTKL